MKPRFGVRMGKKMQDRVPLCVILAGLILQGVPSWNFVTFVVVPLPSTSKSNDIR